MTQDGPDLRHRLNVLARESKRSMNSIMDVLSAAESFRGGQTGCPVLVNTRFNVRGEPIICSLDDGYRCFLSTDMDALVIKDDYPAKRMDDKGGHSGRKQKYLAQFELD
jgi:predicted NodU family carbamoyl transferase